jgi:hypothetical protein
LQRYPASSDIINKSSYVARRAPYSTLLPRKKIKFPLDFAAGSVFKTFVFVDLLSWVFVAVEKLRTFLFSPCVDEIPFEVICRVLTRETHVLFSQKNFESYIPGVNRCRA